MSSVTFPPAAAYSPAQPPLPTPSPFSFSVASTRRSSRPPIQIASLSLRFISLVLSFGSTLSLVALPSTNTKLKQYPELLYCFTANIFTILYAAYQIFKNICDIAHRGIFISDTTSDYTSFIFDQVTIVSARTTFPFLIQVHHRESTVSCQLAGYLLVSASSVAVPVIQQMDYGNSLWNASIVSVCLSFASFLVNAVNALLSGYKLCKRIMW